MGSKEFFEQVQTAVDNDQVWYAIYVRSRYEKVVFEELVRRQIKTSLPMLTKISKWSDRKKEIKAPWFPGYVFVKIDLSTEKFTVLEIPGVVKYVPTNNKPVSIHESEMYWLQVLVAENLTIRHETKRLVGEAVTVNFGPLKGYQGQVIAQKSETRIIIWLDAIMQGVSVELDPRWLDSAK
jgi:transcription termination/antitermination protein NusG